MIHVAAAIIRNADGEILICQRGPGGSCAYLWEFPGGKRESGESMEDCIRRECLEELEIELALDGVFTEVEYAYPERTIAFTFFNARITGGTLKMDVHNDMRWVSPAALASYDFCPADTEIVQKLSQQTE